VGTRAGRLKGREEESTVPGHEVRFMFHSTAMVADYDLAVARLRDLFGLAVLEYSESAEPGIGRRGGMGWLGDNALEVGQPLGEGAAAQFVDRHGGGVHSVALQVRDLGATAAHLEAAGVRIAARPRPEMCFSDPRDTCGVFLQWSCFELDVDPRFGAPMPRPVSEPAVRVDRHAFVGALVDDPLPTARRLAGLLGTEVTFGHPDADAGDPVAGVSLGDCTLALYALAPAQSPVLWGRRYDRARTHLVALQAGDLAAAQRSLEGAGVAVLRAEDGLVLLDPAATGGVQTALTDRLLSGDPRNGERR
jgi:catechol 2,3-dioxygenase-like lactoylglutathione lyase family enzyme